MDSLIYKIQLLRKTENLKQTELSSLTGVPLGVIKKIDSGKQATITATNLLKIINCPRFKKYSMWLTADEIDTTDVSAAEITTDHILKEIESLPADIKEQAETMAKMLVLEQKTNLIDELAKQVENLRND